MKLFSIHKVSHLYYLIIHQINKISEIINLNRGNVIVFHSIHIQCQTSRKQILNYFMVLQLEWITKNSDTDVRLYSLSWKFTWKNQSHHQGSLSPYFSFWKITNCILLILLLTLKHFQNITILQSLASIFTYQMALEGQLIKISYFTAKFFITLSWTYNLKFSEKSE